MNNYFVCLDDDWEPFGSYVQAETHRDALLKAIEQDSFESEPGQSFRVELMGDRVSLGAEITRLLSESPMDALGHDGYANHSESVVTVSDEQAADKLASEIDALFEKQQPDKVLVLEMYDFSDVDDVRIYVIAPDGAPLLEEHDDEN